MAFVRTFNGADLDASLLSPLVGFVAPSYPRMLGTVRAIESKPMRSGFILRYDTMTAYTQVKGPSLPAACGMGPIAEAQEVLERVAATANDVGLL